MFPSNSLCVGHAKCFVPIRDLTQSSVAHIFIVVSRYTLATTQEGGLLLAGCPRLLTHYIQLLAYQDVVLSDWNQRKRQAVINHVRTHRHTKACYIMRFFGRFPQNCEKRLLVRHVCPSACPHGTTRLPLHGFSYNFTFWDFSKICR